MESCIPLTTNAANTSGAASLRVTAEAGRPQQRRSSPASTRRGASSPAFRLEPAHASIVQANPRTLFTRIRTAFEVITLPLAANRKPKCNAAEPRARSRSNTVVDDVVRVGPCDQMVADGPLLDTNASASMN
jgi:hypothetical protein